MQTLRQLNALWHKGEKLELRAITPDRKCIREFFDTPEAAAAWAEQLQGVDVYVGANPRAVERGDKEAIQTLTALYVDLDVKAGTTQAAMREALEASELVPTMIVSSGKGLHAYWLIEPTTDKARWREVNTQLYRRFADLGADKQVATDEARTLRLVPFPNLKYGEPLPAELLHVDDRRYTLDEVARAYPAPEVVPVPVAVVPVPVAVPVIAEPVDTKSLIADPNHQRLANRLLRCAAEQARHDGSAKAGFDLARQLYDNNHPNPEAVMTRYAAIVEHMGNHAYSREEAMQSLKSAYHGDKREPWALQTQTDMSGDLQGEVQGDGPADGQAAIEMNTIQVIDSLAVLTSDTAPDVLTRVRQFHPTDAGNAELFAYRYGERLRFNRANGRWYSWNGVRWHEDSHNMVGGLALEAIRLRQQALYADVDDEQRGRKFAWAVVQENLHKQRAMLELAAGMPPFITTANDWDQDRYAAAVMNGVLDLRQVAVMAAKPETYISKALGTRYDPTATCPRWEQFVDEVFNHDAELIAYIQRAVGYSLTGDTREHAMFLCYGGGKNGKSVFLATLSKLFGDYGATAGFATFEANHRDQQTNDLARLKGVRFVAISEANEDRMMNEARVKSVTGGDRITCRFLNKEFFEYTPELKIWLAMNHKPIVRGTDDGIWRRIHLIPFTQKFDGEREDKTLTAKLEAELPGILNWALEGLALWHQHGLGMPDAVRREVDGYRKESDDVARWLEDIVVVTGDRSDFIAFEDLYANYKEWATRNSQYVRSVKYVGDRLSSLGFEIGKERIFGSGQKKVRYGVRWIDEQAVARITAFRK